MSQTLEHRCEFAGPQTDDMSIVPYIEGLDVEQLLKRTMLGLTKFGFPPERHPRTACIFFKWLAAFGPVVGTWKTGIDGDGSLDHDIGEKQPVPEVTPAVDVGPGGISFEEETAGWLGRHLGVISCTLLVIGTIVGTGIFSTPSSILSRVGSIGASLMLWVLGFVLSFCGSFIWLEFGTMYPRSGGEKVYLEAIYQRPKYLATVVFDSNIVLLGFSAGGCVVFASNILVAAGRVPTNWSERGVALEGWLVLSGKTHIANPEANFTNAFVGSSHSSGDYATAAFKAFYTFNGWSSINYVLNNVRNPVRTLKIAGPLGLGICATLYILANIAYFSAATKAEIESSGVTMAALFFRNVF
ncbi:hypothetical protein OG21DRAFT_588293 [Imleria badia]|nr:hypothetical protein OG21DRAFT_588293 [Imleria badia]